MHLLAADYPQWKVGSLTLLVPGMDQHLRSPIDYDLDGIRQCMHDAYAGILQDYQALNESDLWAQPVSVETVHALMKQQDALYAREQGLRSFSVAFGAYVGKGSLGKNLWHDIYSHYTHSLSESYFRFAETFIALWESISSAEQKTISRDSSITPYRVNIQHLLATKKKDRPKESAIQQQYESGQNAVSDLVHRARDPKLSDAKAEQLFTEAFNLNIRNEAAYAGHYNETSYDISASYNGYDRRLIDAMIAISNKYLPQLTPQILHAYSAWHIDKPRFSAQETQDILVSAFTRLSPEFGEIAQRAFNENWLHISKSQSPGLRSSMLPASLHEHVPGAHTMAHIEYDGNCRSLYTAVHELGHAIADHIAGQHQSQRMKVASQGVHELFSHFSEALLRDELAHRFPDQPWHHDAIYFIQQTKRLETTIYGKALKQFYDKVEQQQETLTVQDVRRIIADVQKGIPDFSCQKPRVFLERISRELSHKPHHIHVYAIEQLLAQAMHESYRQDPQSFAKKLHDTMAAGATITFENAAKKLTGTDFLKNPELFDEMAQRIVADGEALVKSKPNLIKQIAATPQTAFDYINHASSSWGRGSAE